MHFNVIAQFCVIFLSCGSCVYFNFKFFGKLEGWKLSFTKQPVWKSYCGYKLKHSQGTHLEWRVWQRKMWANEKTCDKKQHAWNSKEWVFVCQYSNTQTTELPVPCPIPTKTGSNVIKKWPAKWDHEDSMAKADCMPHSIWNCVSGPHMKSTSCSIAVWQFSSAQRQEAHWPMEHVGWVDNHIALVLYPLQLHPQCHQA